MTTTPKTLWIGPDESLTLGQYGFLIETSHTNDGWIQYTLSDTPARTNRSHEPKLYGWCGTWNDIATHARGMYRVVRLARNHRAYVEELEGADLGAALEELGYPNL